MTVALAVALAVVLVTAAALAWAARRSGLAARRAEERAEQVTGRLGEASGRLAQVQQQQRATEVRATAAEGRLRAAETKAGEAERRAGEAEKRVAEAMRRADEAERLGPSDEVAGAMWDLERSRMEREWLDVVGPGVPLPVPWDGSVDAVVAAELSVIREVIGTPSRLRLEEGNSFVSPAIAAAAARVSIEMLRTLARSGEEMEVVVGLDALTVVQPVSPGEEPPDLSGLAAVARGAGFDLTFAWSEGRSEARLGFP
jgi:hypothetical protein